MSAYIATPIWLEELAPDVEVRDVLIQQFERQTGERPTKVLMIAELGVWGVASCDAVMLFKVPA